MKRSIAALALVVATPAFGPRVSSWPLESDAFVDWAATRAADEVAADRLFEPSAAGIPVASLGSDGADWTMQPLQAESGDDAAPEALPGLGGGSARSSAAASGTSGAFTSAHAAAGAAALAAASDARSLGGPGFASADSQAAPRSLEDSIAGIDDTLAPGGGPNARNMAYEPGSRAIPPVHVATLDPHHAGWTPWHHGGANPPGVVIKHDDIPGPPGGLPGPFEDNGPDDPPIGFIPTTFTPTDFTPTDFTPSEFTPPETLRVTLEANAVPEPGTLALMGLGLAALALLRRKPSPIRRRRR